ncbi:MAG: DUF924 family protein [Pseudomonadota bacterium]
MADLHPEAQSVLDFWFSDHSHEDWFSGAQKFDVEVRIGFAKVLQAAEKSELWHWRTTPRGRVAEIIVLDQFSRQLYRKSGRAFANDALALALAQEGVAQGLDADLSSDERHFLFMPYMHSESLIIHDEAMKLYATVSENALDFERRHRDVIERFGRYPKRNEALRRASTREELEYIAATSGSMF